MWKSSKRLPKTSPCPVLISSLLSAGMQWCSLALRLLSLWSHRPLNVCQGRGLTRRRIQISVWPEGETFSVRELPLSPWGILYSLSIQLLCFSLFFFFKLETNHLQTCCTWLISSPNRSKSPSTQAPFCRHFCTVSSWPRSPACTRRDAIWEGKPQTGVHIIIISTYLNICLNHFGIFSI